MYWIFDTETIPDGELVRAVRYPHRTMSPADAVAEYAAERLETRGSTFIPTSFHLPVALVVAEVDDGFVLRRLLSLDRPAFRSQAIVEEFWRRWLAARPTLVTFHGSGFDLPVLELAAYRYGLPIGGWLETRRQPGRHLDLHRALGGDHRLAGGLDLLAKLVDAPGKVGTRGADVLDLWRAGRGTEIDDYCAADVLNTYLVFLRWQRLLGALDADGERERIASMADLVRPLAAERPALDPFVGPDR